MFATEYRGGLHGKSAGAGPIRKGDADDVARYAGVSTAVVSYVINGGPKPVATATAARVREAIKALQYQPNATARALSLGSTRLLGMIVPDSTNPYFAELTDAIAQAAAPKKTSGAYGTVQRAPRFASWEAPETVIHPYPLILIHGGGGQGTDWTGTPVGRPGWATRFVEAGFVVYVIDRPGHGRSPYHPAVVGEMGAPFPYEAAKSLFYPDDAATDQTQWSYSRTSDSDEVDQLVAAMGPLPDDLAESQRMDAERLV